VPSTDYRGNMDLHESDYRPSLISDVHMDYLSGDMGYTNDGLARIKTRNGPVGGRQRQPCDGPIVGISMQAMGKESMRAEKGENILKDDKKI